MENIMTKNTTEKFTVSIGRQIVGITNFNTGETRFIERGKETEDDKKFESEAGRSMLEKMGIGKRNGE